MRLLTRFPLTLFCLAFAALVALWAALPDGSATHRALMVLALPAYVLLAASRLLGPLRPLTPLLLLALVVGLDLALWRLRRRSRPGRRSMW